MVAVIGDSLAYSVATELDAQLRDVGAEPVFDVAPGRRIPTRGLEGQISSGIEVARDLRARQPDVWVVQLGTNDVAYEPLDQSRYAFWIIAVLEAIGPDAPVVWVNVHRADRPVEAAAFDAVLALLDSERPQLRVADWATVAVAEPVLAADGVHLAPEGGARFAGVIADAVAAALAA
jgi:lysophospholipase L1-like esterase